MDYAQYILEKSAELLAIDSPTGYTDEAAMILAETDGEPHNTITPIARRRGEDFELDLVLRNNLTISHILIHLIPFLHHTNLHSHFYILIWYIILQKDHVY